MASHNQSAHSENSSKAQGEEQKFFNVTTKGLGYLNKVSEKRETGKDIAFKASVSALVGTTEKMEYERFTLYARGDQAIGVLQALQPYLEDDKNKVLIAFSASNCRARGFTPEDGDNAGQLVTYQQGNLIFISCAKVNGEEVYRAPERENQ